MIYQIDCQLSGKSYIGSTIYFENRVKQHFSNLSKNKHHNKAMQTDYNKYGREAFSYKVIDCSEFESKQAMLLAEDMAVKKHGKLCLYNAIAPKRIYTGEKQASVTLSKSMYERIEIRARFEGISMAAWIRRLIIREIGFEDGGK